MAMGRPSYTYWRTVKAGTRSRVSAVTSPSDPSPTTQPRNSSPPVSRRTVRRPPSAVISSSPDTIVARFPWASPEPWVAVATAPATEMCGSEARLGRA